MAPAALVLLAGLVLLAARRGAARGAASSLAGAQLVTAARTGGADAVAWTRSRWGALRDFLAARGMPPQLAARVAADVVTHWADETGWGRSEWLYNVGNIKAYRGWSGAYQVLPDGLSYRAYQSLRDGIADTVALLEAPRYAAAWAALTREGGDGRAWMDALMHAGWHPWSQAALDRYTSERATVRQRVGV